MCIASVLYYYIFELLLKRIAWKFYILLFSCQMMSYIWFENAQFKLMIIYLLKLLEKLPVNGSHNVYYFILAWKIVCRPYIYV